MLAVDVNYEIKEKFNDFDSKMWFAAYHTYIRREKAFEPHAFNTVISRCILDVQRVVQTLHSTVVVGS